MCLQLQTQDMKFYILSCENGSPSANKWKDYRKTYIVLDSFHKVLQPVPE